MSRDNSSHNDGYAQLHGGFRARKNRDALTARDKMQPSLLDRLTDNDPEKKREAGQQQSDHPRRAAPQRAAGSAVVV